MKKILLAFILLVTVSATNVWGQTWNGSVNKDWNTPANWTPAFVPTSSDNVVIPGSLPGSNWPVFAADVTINSINMENGSQLDVNGFVLTLNNVDKSNHFAGTLLNSCNGVSDIVINVNTGIGGFITYFSATGTFSPLTLAALSSGNGHAVNFTAFSAHIRADHAVSVQWKTGLQIDSARFEVQRSIDVRNWVTLTEVLPVSSGEYEYSDYARVTGMNYYRIRQVNKDGDLGYSMVRAIAVPGLRVFSVWPNPVKNFLYVQTPAKRGTLEITDLNGRLVKTTMISNTVTIISVEQLANGMHAIRYRQNGIVYSEKFIKE